MVGFYAEYDGGVIHLQRSELSKGGWYRYDQLPHIPEKLSIARKLIDHWIEQKTTSSTSDTVE
jgi:NAD+ diphosphatase